MSLRNKAEAKCPEDSAQNIQEMTTGETDITFRDLTLQQHSSQSMVDVKNRAERSEEVRRKCFRPHEAVCRYANFLAPLSCHTFILTIKTYYFFLQKSITLPLRGGGNV